VFGVSSGKLLGYMVSTQGINTISMKVEAIKIATTTNPKRDPEAGLYDGSTQPFYIQIR
jgi:hypothetical protein